MLMTREMRERAARKAEAAKPKYSQVYELVNEAQFDLLFFQTLIQIRLPDNVILQAEFGPAETIGSVISVLRKCIADPEAKFELCIQSYDLVYEQQCLLNKV